MRVFVSSTYEDLALERGRLQELFTRLSAAYVGMEFFPATGKTPKAVALEEIEKCDAVIFLIAHRYGSIDRTSGKSIVELEYEAAASAEKEILVYFKDPKTPVMIDYVDSKGADDLGKFKKRLSRHHRSTFRNADHLTTLVALDIFDQFSKSGLPDAIPRRFLDSYRLFWAETLQGRGASLIMEVGKYGAHPGEVEAAKNINGVLGVAKLIPVLQQLDVVVNIKAARSGMELNQNLILDGSLTGNSITKKLVEHRRISQSIVYKNSNTKDLRRRWLENTKTPRLRYESSYKGRGESRALTYDFGFLARVDNPFSPSKKCLVASGNHGAGTYACMSVLAGPELLEEIHRQVGAKPFQAVVGIEVGQMFGLGSPEIHEVVAL